METSNVSTSTPQLTSTVIGTVARMVSREPRSISPETRFLDDLNFDSTMVLELLMNLETDLDTEFDPETLEPSDFDTVGTLVAYLTRQFEA
ncbi:MULTISPECIES: acyl carrier protein [Streptomyces]|uniref:Carrier domain-containing protein n=1 Tax=Streptomyces canarius TaxID=285453 RepID=A0ABQ3D216_9ACTN|nr:MULTISPECIES: acyl carrier protein [Streptomyces]GGZ09215.1 hypothetical protein GCM10010300_61420 [Streptomyces olivaceoviridis]GHA52202.1 hypothetical protein GCM10010345_65980 [Streptomyces canarius]